MGGTTSAPRASDNFSRDELKMFQTQLQSIARDATSYPLECSLGAYELLFESRQDIEVIVDHLSEEIALPRGAA